MRVFDAAATAAGLPFAALIAGLRERFRSGACVPAREIYQLGGAAPAELTSLIMPAWVPGQAYGVKVVNVAPANSQRGLPGVSAAYTLFDAVTGVPVAHMDGSVLTARRTAAASALAGSFLARAEAQHLLVVGAGSVASLLPSAYAVVRPIRTVTVWARDPNKAARLAETFAGQGFAAHAAADLRQALRQADIISCATPTSSPLIAGACLQPGSHLDLIGGFTPDMREADDACFGNGARWWADTEEALQKSGDLLQPMERGLIHATDLQGTLETLCRGLASGRHDAAERTIFKSVGTALEDLAAAMLLAGMQQ